MLAALRALLSRIAQSTRIVSFHQLTVDDTKCQQQGRKRERERALSPWITIARKSMHIRQELQNAYGITVGTQESRRHAAIISDALQRHRHAFSHFITLQPRRFDLLDHVATVVRDEFSASLPGMTTGRNARFYIAVSISPQWFYRTLSQARDVFLDSKTFHRDTKLWHHPADSVPLFAPWHLHALVGSLPFDLSNLALQESISRGTALHDVDVRTIDGHAALNTYITDPMRGNHLMGLQFTNDTFLYNQCLKRGVQLNWCPPYKPSRNISTLESA